MKRANRFMLLAGVMLAGVAFVAVIAFGGMGTAPVVAPPADRRTVAAGQALTAGDFDTNALAQIAQSLQPGLRAIAVPLSKVDSVGALLQPGDRVDALISMTDADALNPIVQPNPNAGQTTVDGSALDPYLVLAAQLKSDDQADLVQSAGLPEPDVVVILAVTPQQAEIVRYAELDGNISLVLRAPGDAGAADATTTGITLKWLVALRSTAARGGHALKRVSGEAVRQ